MSIHTICMAAFLATSAAQAQGSVQISIGVRETGFGGSTVGTIGANGGSVGGIEWINRDAQTLVLDGSWQQFTFTFATDPVTGFAGTSANGVLEGSYGVLEHIRVLNNAGVTAPIVLLLDDVTDSTATLGSVNFGDFQSYAAGAQAMFRNAGFSGSTSTNVLTGSTTAVQNTFPSGSASLRFDFQFVDGTPTRWVRLTSFNTANQPNPVVRFDDQSVVTFRLLGFVECQQNLGYQGPGNVSAVLCGSGLNAGEASAFLAAGAAGNAFGAVGVSFPGFPDLPIVGGTIASGTGLLLTVPIVADASGQARLPLAGDASLVDFVMQAVFLDLSLPQSVAFSAAFLARFGQ